MIRNNTVIILGAGASAGAPLNYPIGSDLRDVICNNLSGPSRFSLEIAQALAEEKEDLDDYLKAVIKFRDCFYRSSELTIDAFIKNNYKAYGNIAKCAIAQALLSYEDKIKVTETFIKCDRRVYLRLKN